MFDDFKVANYSKALLSPELFGRHLSRLFTGDVVDGLTVTPGTGLQVVLTPGNAFVRYGSANVASARYVSLVANFNLAIATADASNPRIDLVVVYVDNGVSLPGGTPTTANLDGKGVAKAKIVQGTASASPSAPNSTAIQASVGSGNPYTVVAQVRVDAGVSVIAGNKITDVRSLVRLTSDRIDSSTSTYVRARKNTTQTMNNSTSGVHTFPEEIIDVLNEYDNSTSTFVAKQTGNYFISASTRFTAAVSTGGFNLIAIRVNGTSVMEANTLGTSAYRNISIDKVLPLAVGDQVTIFWNNSSGSSLTADNNTASQQLIISRVG